MDRVVVGTVVASAVPLMVTVEVIVLVMDGVPPAVTGVPAAAVWDSLAPLTTVATAVRAWLGKEVAPPATPGVVDPVFPVVALHAPKTNESTINSEKISEVFLNILFSNSLPLFFIYSRPKISSGCLSYYIFLELLFNN